MKDLKELKEAFSIIEDLRLSITAQHKLERCPEIEFQQRIDSYLINRNRHFWLIWLTAILFILSMAVTGTVQIFGMKASIDNYESKTVPNVKEIKTTLTLLDSRVTILEQHPNIKGH